MSEQQMNKELINEIMNRWAKLTANEPEERPHLPIRVLLGEAVDLAEVVDHYFETVTVNGKVRLGLDSVIGRGGISERTAEELRELHLSISNAQSRYLILVEQISRAPVERAEELLSELRATLGFIFSEGSNLTGEKQLERLRDEYDSANSHDGMALALEGYAELASQHSGELGTLAGFDMQTIEHAIQVAQALRQRSADRLTGQAAQDQRDMLRLRNRLINALMARMSRVRSTMRFVFREYPEIVQKATSEYRRNQKRSSRKAQSEAPSSGISGHEPTMEVPTPQLREG